MPGKKARAVEIISLNLEGGGCEIMGRRGPEGWTFWQTGTSIDIDLDDNEVWRSFETEPVPILAEALPEDWWIYFPSQLHEDFVEQVRAEYERTKPLQLKRRRQEAGIRDHLDSVAEKWRELLG